MRFRFLRSLNTSSSSSSSSSQSPPSDDGVDTVDSDFVVILAALLCALICVLGLVAVARCAWLRRFSGGAASTPANKGLKKKVLKSLPKFSYSADQHAGKLSDDCAICLSEFISGEEIRVLPQCGHGFHLSCIDTWLGSHSSCPSCRQILAVRCHKCGGGLPENSNTSSSSTTTAAAATATTTSDEHHSHNHIHSSNNSTNQNRIGNDNANALPFLP